MLGCGGRPRGLSPYRTNAYRWLLPCLLILAATACAQQTIADRPLRVSENHRYLIAQDGTPYFLQGDAAWSLIANLTKEEAVQYLQNRKAKGFNALLVNLLEHKFAKNAPKNVYGEAPFPNMSDWSVPNEKYFEHADWVIRQAAANGQVVLLAPVYLGYPGTDEGFIDEVMANGPEKLLQYGSFLGQRYKDFDNIIWVMGGDRDPGPARENVDMIAYGIRQYDKRHLFTAHCHSDSPPAEQYPGSWLDISTSYTGQIVHRRLIEDYNRKPVMPSFLIESAYEGEHNSSEVQIRRQAYWTVLSGGFGHVMGNRPIWLFDPGWQKAMDDPGSVGMMHWGKLFRSRQWFDLVPDQEHKVVTDGLGEFLGLDYLTAARTSDGSTVIAYMPTTRTITVDMAKLSASPVNAWWFDPRTGKATSAGSFPAGGSRQFTPAAQGDWVLVLDVAAIDRPAPGP
jgi:hypothetical protein